MSSTEAHTPSLESLLAECTRLDASDLHVAPGVPPTFRVHGDLVAHAAVGPLDRAATEALCNELLATSGTRGLEATGAQDGALTGRDGTRFRFNVYRRLGGIAAAVRRLEERFRTLAELGLPESLYELCDIPDGLVVVAGPTGAGKSTTLAALVDRINRTRRVHVITIEDPIEYVHAPIASLVQQRQVGTDASSFQDALVASLREDPDVILVGEVRDLDTIRTAIRAAETGHLVLTTVHAGDAVGALERLASVFPSDEQVGIRRQLGLVLRAVVAQRLLPRDGVRASPRAQRATRRVVASEILRANTAIAHLLATGRTPQIYAALESGGAQGMQTFEHDLARLLADGTISDTTARANARSPELLRARTLHENGRTLSTKADR
ncbi:MAG: type IV pilus twitching motility protein PilT [Planctomycetota bacterium]